LTLSNATLENYTSAPQTAGPNIQVDAATMSGAAPKLELQTTTIDGDNLATSTLNVDGLLVADDGTANKIERFAAGNFTNDGEVQVTGNGTVLTLSNDTLDDYNSG